MLEKLDLWRTRLPTENDLDYTSDLPAFSAVSYNYILAGMDQLPENPLPAEAMQDLGLAKAVFEDRRKGIAATIAEAPYHMDMLDQIHGGGETANGLKGEEKAGPSIVALVPAYATWLRISDPKRTRSRGMKQVTVVPTPTSLVIETSPS